VVRHKAKHDPTLIALQQRSLGEQATHGIVFGSGSRSLGIAQERLKHSFRQYLATCQLATAGEQPGIRLLCRERDCDAGGVPEGVGGTPSSGRPFHLVADGLALRCEIRADLLVARDARNLQTRNARLARAALSRGGCARCFGRRAITRRLAKEVFLVETSGL